MAEGGTSVGSIKGLLELDISDFMSGIEQAEAASDKLTSGDDDIHIDANITEAMAKMDEAASKADEVAASDPDIQVDADTASAMAQLEEVNAKADETDANDTDMQVDADITQAMGGLDAVAAKSEQIDADRITAKVEAQVDSALAEIDAVAMQAEALDDKPVTVQVDAKTGGAVAQIQAVSEAQAELNMSTARLRAAYSNLDEVQSQSVVSQSSLMTAEAALSRVESQHAAAQEKLNAACSEYGVVLSANTGAQRANGSASGSQATATRTAASAMETDSTATQTDTAAKSANTAATDAQTQSYGNLRGALMLAAPALIPIAGAAAGAGAALIGMAATGIIAVKGIQMAMDDGSVTGKQYSADIQTLQSDFTGLKNTGAVNYLNGMNDVTRELHSGMPMLNTDIGMFSKGLGTISGNTVSGVLGLLKQLTPVLVDVNGGLMKSSASFKQWGTGSGAKEFVSYLLDRMPAVSSTLGSLFGAAGHVVNAFEPWSGVVLTVVKGVSDVISAIPTPVLSALAVGAMSAYTAFKAWSIIAPMVQGVQTAIGELSAGASITSVINPAALAVVAIGGLAAAYMAFTGSTKEATNQQSDFLSALQESNGAIDDGVRKQVAKTAVDEGMIDLSKQLGIGTKQVTESILDQGGAYERVKTKLEGNINASREFSAQNGYNSKSLVDAANASQKLLDKLDDSRGKFSDAAQEEQLLSDATADTSGTIEAQAQILGLSQGEWERLSAAEASASSAANDYKAALDSLNGQAQTLDQATSALTLQFDTMASTIKSNIEKVGAAQATSMDVNTTYGAKNHQLIQQTVKDAQDKADAIINSEGKSQKSYADARASLEQSRQKILEVATANGLNADEVNAYLDQIMQLPADVTTQIIVDDSQAQAGLEALQVKTATVAKDGKSITITADNEQALQAIADVTGAKINPKTGELTLDKAQYDVALAIANGAKIDEKTGQLKGDNSDMFAKLMQANGWTIDEKTGMLKGNNGQYMTALGITNAASLNDKSAILRAIDQASGVIANLNSMQIADKFFTIHGSYVDDSGGTYSGSGYRPKGAMGNIPTGYTGGMFTGSSFLPGYANGGEFSGAVTGPYSPIKDNIVFRNARLNPGEHVLNVDDVKAMGGQRAVYAFRSNLHKPANTTSASPDHDMSKTGRMNMTPYLPATITLVDADGSLLAKMRTIVRQAQGAYTTSLVRGLING